MATEVARLPSRLPRINILRYISWPGVPTTSDLRSACPSGLCIANKSSVFIARASYGLPVMIRSLAIVSERKGLL